MSAVEKPSVLSPFDVAVAIRKAWADFVLSGRSAPGKRHNVYASSYRACVRQMVLEMTDGDKVAPWSADTLANFRRGSDRERDLLADLKKIGRNAEPAFETVGEQERFELKDHKGRVAISGKVDCRLRIAGTRISAPLEVKSWNANLTARVKRFEDLLDNRWTRSGAMQLLCYLYAANEEFGFMMLDRPGIPFLLPVELFPHLNHVENFLQKAELAMDHREAGTLPDFIDDPGECRYCSLYGAVCNPPMVHTGAKVLTDPAFLLDLEQWHELKPAAKEFERLDEEIKEQLRGTESAIAGAFVISGKYQKKTSYAFPDEETKRKFQTSDPRGKFVLTIEKVGE